MADDVKTQTDSTPVGSSQSSTTTPSPDVGAAAVDWAAKYKELETQYQPLTKYREYFPDATPDDVKQGVDWALNIYKQVREGQLVPKQAPAAPASSTPSASTEPPWKQDGWEILPASTQAERLTEYQEKKLASVIAAKEQEFRGAMDNTGKLYGRQQNILLKALQAAQKNPSLDVNTILNKANEAAQLPAEALIDQIVEAASRSPEAEEARISKLVEERLATRLQEESNKKLDLITSQSRIPRGLASIAKRTIADENKDILKQLAAKGITF